MNALISLPAVGALLLFAGCASSKLSVELAVYSDDVSKLLSEDNIAKAIARARLASDQARALHERAAKQSDAAHRLREAYEIVFIALSQARVPPASDSQIEQDLDGLRSVGKRYDTALVPLLETLPRLLEGVEGSISMLEAANNASAVDPTSAAKRDTLGIAKRALLVRFTALQVLLSSHDKSAGGDFIPIVNLLIENLKKRLGVVPAAGDVLPMSHPTVQSAIKRAAELVSTYGVSGPEVVPMTVADGQAALDGVVVAVKWLSAAEEKTNNESRAIEQVSLFRSMHEFDNLQNAADPAWRLVRDPRNEAKWVKQKAGLYYYSEGKNSVVVVRDRPDDFRVQSASNNPTQLVRSHLQITRAISNTLIAIGGAALGSNALTPRIPPGAPTPPADGVADSEKLAADAAKLAAEERLRRSTVETLRLRLVRLDAQTLAASGNATQLNAVVDELHALMSAVYSALPAPPAP